MLHKHKPVARNLISREAAMECNESTERQLSFCFTKVFLLKHKHTKESDICHVVDLVQAAKPPTPPPPKRFSQMLNTIKSVM